MIYYFQTMFSYMKCFCCCPEYITGSGYSDRNVNAMRAVACLVCFVCMSSVTHPPGWCRPCCISPWILWTGPTAPQTPASTQTQTSISSSNWQKWITQQLTMSPVIDSKIWHNFTSWGWLVDASITMLVSSCWGSAEKRDIQDDILSVNVHNTYTHVWCFPKYFTVQISQTCRIIFMWFIT